MSAFFETSMMTTLGATISKTLAKALLSWCTTSLPCSAAAAGIVGLGTPSGVAAKIDIVLSAAVVARIWMTLIGSKLDSIQHATFNAPVHCGPAGRGSKNRPATRLTRGIISAGFLQLCVQ